MSRAKLSRLRLSFAALLIGPALACADRITQMPAAELCVYKAKLSVAGYYHVLQGRARSEVVLHWHGDETANEKQFVEHTIDEAYETAAADKREHPDIFVPEQLFGDRVYKRCMASNGR